MDSNNEGPLATLEINRLTMEMIEYLSSNICTICQSVFRVRETICGDFLRPRLPCRMFRNMDRAGSLNSRIILISLTVEPELTHNNLIS